MNATATSRSLPPDIRMTNALAGSVGALAVLLLVMTLAAWALRLPGFELRSIRIDGDTEHNSAASLRAAVAPQLAGNFFTMNLPATRAAFESVPWVRQAVVRRVWPSGLDVSLQEHQPAALWDDDAGAERLVNSYGEVFEADAAEVAAELPTLAGPAGSSARLLRLYERLTPVFEPLRMRIVWLRQSERGSLRARMAGGSTVELGRGSDDELVARAERFVRTLPQALAPYEGRSLQYADLRHAEGYALRIRGVGTVDDTPPAATSRAAPRPAAGAQRTAPNTARSR